MMLYVDLVSPHCPAYGRVARFARDAYQERFGAAIAANPDLFAYSQLEGSIVGCLGLYRAPAHEPLLFETYVPHAYERIAGAKHPDRALLAELGTKVIRAPRSNVFDISIAVTAALLLAAHQNRVRYVGFTTNLHVKRVTDTLGFSLVRLGRPDLREKDEAFLDNWARYFSTPQFCFGFELDSITGCAEVIAELAQKDIHVRKQNIRIM